MVFLQKTQVVSNILFLISGNNKFDQLDGTLEKVDIIPQNMDSFFNELDFP